MPQGGELKGLWFDRSREFSARRRGVELTLEERTEVEQVNLKPLRCSSGLTESVRKELIGVMVSEIEKEAALERTTSVLCPGNRSEPDEGKSATPTLSSRPL